MSLVFNTPKTGLNTATRNLQNMGSGSCKLTDVSVEYTKNGDYSVELPEGYDGFSSVDVKVNVQGGSSTSIYDGSFDEDGLRAIGWDDNDIAYFEASNPHFAWQDADYMVTDADRTAYELLSGGAQWKSLTMDLKASLRFCPKIEGRQYGYSLSAFSDYITLQYSPNIIGVPVMDTYSDLSYVFSKTQIRSIPPLDTSNVTLMYQTFNECACLVDVPLIDTSNVTDMFSMFGSCSRLTSVPLFNTSKLTNMRSMFGNCVSLVSIPSFNTQNVTNMNSTFQKCSNLQRVPALDTSNVNSCTYLFQDAPKLATIEGIDLSGITSNTNNMFYGTTKNVTRFIVNGKMNYSFTFTLLTNIDYDSVKSLLEAANRTDNTDAKTLFLKVTMSDPDGELTALVASCATKGWTITGLTLN